MTVPSRGDIFVVEFDPTRGHEIRKTRPALIIQNNFGNRYSQVTILAAITSKLSPVAHPVELVIRPSRTSGLSPNPLFFSTRLGPLTVNGWFAVSEQLIPSPCVG